MIGILTVFVLILISLMDKETAPATGVIGGTKGVLLVSLLGLSGPSLIFMSSFLIEIKSISLHQEKLLFESGSFLNSFFSTGVGIGSGAVIAGRLGLPEVVGMVPGGFAGFKVGQVLEGKSDDAGEYIAKVVKKRRNPRRDDGSAVKKSGDVKKFV